jgi:hypothetical protein
MFIKRISLNFLGHNHRTVDLFIRFGSLLVPCIDKIVVIHIYVIERIVNRSVFLNGLMNMLKIQRFYQGILMKFTIFKLENYIISILFVGAWATLRLITDKHSLSCFKIPSFTMHFRKYRFFKVTTL